MIFTFKKNNSINFSNPLIGSGTAGQSSNHTKGVGNDRSVILCAYAYITHELIPCQAGIEVFGKIVAVHKKWRPLMFCLNQHL